GPAWRLHERTDRLGGKLRLARANPARAEVGLAIDWWQRELVRLGVAIELGSDVDRELVRRTGADLVIVATGSVPRRDGFQSLRPAFTIGGDSSRPLLSAGDGL